MQHKRLSGKPMTFALAATMAATSMPIGVAHAGLMSTETMVRQDDATSARAQMQTLLSRDDIRDELQAQGIDPAEAEARVMALSDAEVMRLSGQIEALPAGQGLGTIVGAAVVVFIVLLITDIAGFTNVFSFVN